MLRARSACDVVLVTVSVAVADAGPEVWLAAFTVAVSEITVPSGVPALTV